MAFLYPRVASLEDESGRSLVLLLERAPGVAEELYQEVRQVIEAAFLAELSQPLEDSGSTKEERLGSEAGPSAEDAGDLPWNRVCLLSYVSPSPDWASALRAFGLVRSDLSAISATLLAKVRGQVGACDGRDDELPHLPSALWVATLSCGQFGKIPHNAERALRRCGGTQPWGSRPGELARAFAELAGWPTTWRQSFAVLDALEAHWVTDEREVVRWLPRGVFQAMCDVLGVVGESAARWRVEWAQSEPDEQGLWSAPLLRWQAPGNGQPVLFPVALHLLRWWVMPLQEGEEVLPLRQWAEHYFIEAA